MTVEGPVKKQLPDGMSHRGVPPPPPPLGGWVGGAESPLDGHPPYGCVWGEVPCGNAGRVVRSFACAPIWGGGGGGGNKMGVVGGGGMGSAG